MRQRWQWQRFQRTWTTLVLSAATMTGLSACAPEVPLPGGPDAGGAATTPTPEPTRTVTGASGEVEIPARPERIVALWPSTLAAVVQLGFDPVGAVGDPQVHDGGLAAYAPEEYPLEGVTVVASPTDLNVRQVADLEPDLIIGIDAAEQARHQTELSEIAPTVLLPWAGPESWQDHFAAVAALFGDEAQAAAEQVAADYRGRVEELRETLGSRAAQVEVSLMRLETPEEVLLGTSRSFSGSVIADLGLEQPPAQQPRNPNNAYLSAGHAQLVPTADGDVIFMMHDDSEGQAEEAVAAATGSPEWQQLSAVQRDRDVSVDYEHWGAPSYVAAHRILDDVEAAFTGGQPDPVEPDAGEAA